MKKNKMSRLATALLILVLLTTSIVGSTFAKYTTTGSASDTARVAKWGVTVNTSGSLYSDAYAIENAADGKGNLPAQWTSASPDADKITVAATTAKDNIVAPGTKSAGGLSFSISGKPEVAVKVSTTITAEDIYLKAGTYGVLVEAAVNDDLSLKKILADNTAGGVYKEDGGAYTKVADGDTYIMGKYYVLTNEVKVDDYFPVKYKLDGGTTGTDINSAVRVAEKLARTIDADANKAENETYKVKYSDISHDYAANTDLGNDTTGPHFGEEKLSWEWEFENADDDTKKINNAADTILGNLIAAKKDDTVTYKVVSVGTDKAVTALTIGKDDDFTVKSGTDVVANLQTKFDITLTVTQVD